VNNNSLLFNRPIRHFVIGLTLCLVSSSVGAGTFLIASAQQAASSDLNASVPAALDESDPAAGMQRESFDSAASMHLKSADDAHARGDTHVELRHRVLLAEARQAQGRYADAAESLSGAIELAEASKDVRHLATVRGALGNVLIALGADDAAEREFSSAASLAREAGAIALAASLGNNLGNYFSIRLGNAAADNDAFAEMGLAIYSRPARRAGGERRSLGSTHPRKSRAPRSGARAVRKRRGIARGRAQNREWIAAES
jgi:tetratricopeptide (TPR) repeat protein